MRGGKRIGAGRKPSESTVRVSVPVGVLDDVMALIASYRQGELKADQHLKMLSSLSSVQNNKLSLKDNQEIKVSGIEPDTKELSLVDNRETNREPSLICDPSSKPLEFDKQALRDLGRVPKEIQRRLRSQFGSLVGAVKAGCRAERSDGKWIVSQWV